MDTELVDRVITQARRGADILFGRTHSGTLKIKVKHGPFKLLTSRYNVDPLTYEGIKRQLYNA